MPIRDLFYSLLINKGNDNNTYFTDGKHEYHFSVSKNTLFMIFSDLEKLFYLIGGHLK